MRRTLRGYRRRDLRVLVDRHRERVEEAREARARRLEAVEREIAAILQSVSDEEGTVAQEVERMRALLGELTASNERYRKRVNEARARFEAAEAHEWAALAALEQQVAERRSLAESLGRDVVATVAKAQAALNSLSQPTIAETPPTAAPDTGADAVEEQAAGVEPAAAAHASGGAAGPGAAEGDLPAPTLVPSARIEAPARGSGALWLAGSEPVGT